VSHELLRPRSVAELLDVAFTLIRAHFAVFATLATVAALPLLVTSAIALAMYPEGSEAASSVDIGPTIITAVLAIFAWLWFFIAGSSLIFATADAYRGQKVEAGSAFRRAMRATGDVLGASVAKYVVLIGIFFAAAIVGGILGAVSPVLAVAVVCVGLGAVIVLTLRWYTVTSVAALEGVTGSDALSRSRKLMRDAGARAFLMLLVTFALQLSFTLAGSAAAGLAGEFSGANTLDAIGSSLWLIVFPFANVIEAVMYFDQRIRTEGFDLELMTQQLGGVAETAAGSPFDQQRT
jgi:hypothetical protein